MKIKKIGRSPAFPLRCLGLRTGRGSVRERGKVGGKRQGKVKREERKRLGYRA
jgi:hypothetical protein